MSTKHKVLQDFQFIQADKKIIILKAKTLLIDFTYQSKTDKVIIPEDIIANNPEYFQFIDWRMDFLSELKSLKVPQPTIVSKKLIPFVENLLQDSPSEPEIVSSGDDITVNLSNQIANLTQELNIKNKEIESLKSDSESKITELQQKQETTTEDCIPKSKIIAIIAGFRSRGFSAEIFDDFVRQL
jgi:hypothetical protein